MKRTALVFGAVGGVLVTLLRLVEYRFLVVEHSLEVYGGLVAVVFAGVGLWLGITITGRRPATVKEVGRPVGGRFEGAAADLRAPSERAPMPTASTDPRGSSPGTPAPRPPFVRDSARLAELAITARELEILELISAGLSNREIAERLFVSENTVKTHSARLLAKLGAKRRTQAVQRARLEGLIA
jgi:DNA-binding CsgD family transcriptional regulator